MSTKRHKPTVRPWQPMAKATKIQPTPEKLLSIRAWALEKGMDPDEIEALVLADAEMWKSDRYVASVKRTDDGRIYCLSVRRTDRKPDIPWRHLQLIKNEVLGEDAEAVELFPSEDRLVDTANQRWLWVAPRGERFPFGFSVRVVAGPEEAAVFGAVQSPPRSEKADQ